MIVLIALLAVAAISWVYRISFTALLSGDRLPEAVRSRMDAVTPAAFTALIVTDLAGSSHAGDVVPALVAVMAAGVTAWRTHSHLAAVLVAGGAWWLVSAL